MSTFALALQPPRLVHLLTPHQEGAGDELGIVEQRVRELRDSYYTSLALTHRNALVAEEFYELAEEWRRATRFQSSMAAITNQPAYRAIIELGQEAVPLLLGELTQRSEPWFVALRAITGFDPVTPDQRGDMRAMANAWLRWGRTHGFIR